MTGQRIAQFEINQRIGRGGMGEVFRARDTRLNRDVAVKVLPNDFAADADRLRRFEQAGGTQSSALAATASLRGESALRQLLTSARKMLRRDFGANCAL